MIRVSDMQGDNAGEALDGAAGGALHLRLVLETSASVGICALNREQMGPVVFWFLYKSWCYERWRFDSFWSCSIGRMVGRVTAFCSRFDMDVFDVCRRGRGSYRCRRL